jgi:uncharacterized membrane protein YdbT with pleckstrin-like domain
MDDVTIHPSMKTVWLAYALALFVIAAGVWAFTTFAQDQPLWIVAIPCILLLFPIRMHIKRRLVSIRLHDNHLTIESGLFSRMRRTVDMAKIQDVTVRQSFGQRLLGVGDLTLESAGESSGMGMRNVDSPRRIADEIIAGSKRAATAHLPPGPRTI